MARRKSTEPLDGRAVPADASRTSVKVNVDSNADDTVPKLCRHKRPARKRTTTESSTESRDETGYVGETGPKGISNDNVIVDQNNNEMLKNGPTGHNNETGYVADDEMGSSSGPRTEDEYQTVVPVQSFKEVVNDTHVTTKDDVYIDIRAQPLQSSVQTVDNSTQTINTSRHTRSRSTVPVPVVPVVHNEVPAPSEVPVHSETPAHNEAPKQSIVPAHSDAPAARSDITAHSEVPSPSHTGHSGAHGDEDTTEDVVEPIELSVKAPGCRCFVDYRKVCGKCCRCTSKKSKLTATQTAEPRERKLSDISCACIALHFRLALAWLKAKCTCTHNHEAHTLD